MAKRSIEEIKKIIRNLKALDWTEDDICKYLGVKKEDIRNLVRDINL